MDLPQPDLQQARRLLDAAPCHVVLPAGCGKTQIVAELAAAVAHDSRRVLILTHTHAGVDALRRRLRRFGVPAAAVNLQTIASWAQRLVSAYPGAAGCDAAEATWGQTCAGARRALANPHLAGMLRCSYDVVVVDEYQDCTLAQHEMVLALNAVRPTIVFGDPLQRLSRSPWKFAVAVRG